MNADSTALIISVKKNPEWEAYMHSGTYGGFLLNARSIADKFSVSGHPSFFLINKKGNIVYSGGGYGEETEKILREKIEKQLKN